MVDKLPEVVRKMSVYQKPIEKDSPYYQEFKSRGPLYVFNPIEASELKLFKFYAFWFIFLMCFYYN